ncbi:MAG: PAS domain S-box protein [Tepidiformaceae bacterium]
MFVGHDVSTLDLRPLAENAPVALWLSDAVGNCVYVNRHWLAMAGGSLADAMGDGWTQGVHSEDLEPTLVAQRDAIARHTPYLVRYRRLSEDGAEFEVSETATPQFDANGAFVGLVGVCLTDRAFSAPAAPGTPVHQPQLDAHAQRASDEGFAALLDAIPCHIYQVDNQGRLSYVNAHWLEYSGLSGDEARAIGGSTTVHPDDMKVLEHARAARRDQEEPYDSEMRLRRHDGTYRWHMARTIPLRVDGKVVGWVGANVDIDDRKRREAVSDFLADAGGILSQTLDLNTTLKAITDLAVPRLADWCRIDLLGDNGGPNVVVYSNADPRRMAMAAEAQERIGEPVQEEAASDRVIRTGISELIEMAEPLVAELVSRRPELSHLLAEFELRSSVVAAINHGSRRLGALSLVTAESGRRLGQEDVALAEEFAGRISLAIENARLFGNLTAALQAKDDFLGLVSHELRTPLTTLKGTANVLRRHGDQISPADRAQALLDIELGAEQLARIVENMLTLAHAEYSGSAELEPQLLRRLIEGMIADQREQFPGHPVVLTAPQELLPVMANASFFRHIVANLLSNARKYSPPGTTIDVTIERDGDFAAVSVSDCGIGLRQEQIEAVFTPFFRSKEGAARASGIGLGLTVCKRFVEMQGGEIRAEPRAGGGATFRFTLPLAPELLTSLGE